MRTRGQVGAAARLAVCAVAGLGGCGGGAAGGSAPDDLAVGMADVHYDVRADVQIAGGEDVGPTRDPGADHPDGGGLKPCTTGADCPTGFCVERPDGTLVCAPDCVEGVCPPGFACKQVANLVGDIVFVCLPEVQRLCRPCRLSQDCRPTGVLTKDLCVRFGDAEGSFCGQDCSDAHQCPAGYECRETEAPDGGQAWQCLPESGVCECTSDFIEAEYETDCQVSNEHGTCEGVRRCSPGGLTSCSAPTPAPEACNGLDDDCDGQTDDLPDQGPCTLTNEHGSCPGVLRCVGGEVVCTGTGAVVETCNAADDDCDGQTDEEGAAGCAAYYADQDGDGVAGAGDSRCLCGPAGAYRFPAPGADCDDADALVHPGATEECNGRDDDCDGQTDEAGAQGCTTYFLDADGDGWGLGGTFQCLCGPAAPYAATQVTDCDDGNPAVHPGAPEACNGRDDNCDGGTDGEGSQGCVTYYADSDGDGYGVSGDMKCLCSPSGPYQATQGGDCNDSSPAIKPGAIEVCNGVDDDCANGTDEEGAQGCQGYHKDADHDGYGVSGDTKCLCSPSGSYQAAQGGDCNDSNPAIKPGAIEVCNGVDDDCDSQTDEGGVCQPTYKIGINPDDGGGTGACGCGGLCEDNLNLSMGLHLRDFLNADTANPSGGGTWQVFMTRTDDSNPSLAARVAYLNNSGAHRAISISCNTYQTCPNSAVGAETYRKTGADATTNDLAAKVQAQVVSHFQTTDRGVKTGNYYVIVNTAMPHVFVFVGFLTNTGEAAKLNTDSWRIEAARGMLHGLQQHFGYGEFNP